MSEAKTLSIKDWAKEDKPREKLIEKGRKEVSNAELLGILLGSGTKELSAVHLGKEILAKAGQSLHTLSEMEVSDLVKYKGVGPAKAVTIVAAMELGRRLQGENIKSKPTVLSSADLFSTIYDDIVHSPQEEFWAIYLNTRGKVLCKKRISSGGLTDTSVDLRIIFKYGLECNATNFAVAHNHPSGVLTPSMQDDKLTKRIKEAGALLGMKLSDHIIVGVLPNGEASYFSYFDSLRM